MNNNNLNNRRDFLVGGATLLGAAACSSNYEPSPTSNIEARSKSYVFDEPETVSMEIAGIDQRFPVRRVFCLGRNYRAHAIETGDDPDETPPFFFIKPRDAVKDSRAGFPYPPMTKALRYEVEMVVALKSGGADIAEADALSHVYGYGVGLDMTREDLQDIAQE